MTYAIPGGITAKRTLELRQGDCGGHSHLLAALPRAAGIPARTPVGAMYVPLYGGSFGALAEGAEAKTRLLHDEVRAVLALALRGGATAPIELGGQQVSARHVATSLPGLDIEVYLDDQRRLLRYYQKRGETTVDWQR